MVTSSEADAGLKHQFDVRVAFPERIYNLLKIPTSPEPFRRFFELFQFLDRPEKEYWKRKSWLEGMLSYETISPTSLDALSNAYSLGGISLEPPLSSISVSATTDGSRFSSSSLVRFDHNYMETQGQRELPLSEDLLRQRFNLDKKDDLLVILGEDGNPEFEIAKDYTQLGQCW